jgi:hypothetical protein
VEGTGPGPGHVSLVGLSKLIAVPSGDYPEPTQFDDVFVIGPEGFEGPLAFGLGAWEQGRGSVELHDLTIDRLPSPDEVTP